MSKKALIAQLEAELATVKEERLAGKRDPALHLARKKLKQFQKARLSKTHSLTLGNGSAAKRLSLGGTAWFAS